MAKTVGKGKSYSLRGRISAEPEADLVDSSSDNPGDEDMDDARDDDFEDSDFEDDTADEPSSRSEVLAPSDIPVELHRVEGRPRAPIPEAASDREARAARTGSRWRAAPQAAPGARRRRGRRG